MSERRLVPSVIVGLVAVVMFVGLLMVRHARSQVSDVALADQPKGVTVTKAIASEFREQRRYVGTFEPWLEAKIGPQLVSAYVASVLVRPGDVVARGDVLATLDCRDATSASRAMTEQAQALEAKQKAAAAEAERLQGMLAGGFVSPNEVEKRVAESNAAASQLAALRTQASGKELGVSDCIQRAPFAGEVAQRVVDPGAFVRPGSTIVTIVDRSTVRLVLRVPERDVSAIAVDTPVQILALATGAELTAKVTRRAPSAEPATRTLYVEVDLTDTGSLLPVGTTADVTIDVGAAQPATRVPLTAARVRGTMATVMAVDGDTAKRIELKVLGERRGELFVDPSLAAGTFVVVEGRAQLRDGDHIIAKERS